MKKTIIGFIQRNASQNYSKNVFKVKDCHAIFFLLLSLSSSKFLVKNYSVKYTAVHFSDISEGISKHQVFLVMKFYLNIFFPQLLVLLAYTELILVEILFNHLGEPIMDWYMFRSCHSTPAHNSSWSLN